MRNQSFNSTPGDVRLRDVTTADLPVFYTYQLEPEANAMAAFPARERAAFMTHWHRILSDATIVTQTILVGGEVAGNLVCFEQSGQREVGYWLGQRYWGQGVATRALAAFLLQVTQRPLRATVAAHNVASLRVLEKCGFKRVPHEAALEDASVDDIADVLLVLCG